MLIEESEIYPGKPIKKYVICSCSIPSQLWTLRSTFYEISNLRDIISLLDMDDRFTHEVLGTKSAGFISLTIVGPHVANSSVFACLILGLQQAFALRPKFEAPEMWEIMIWFSLSRSTAPKSVMRRNTLILNRK